MTLWALLIIWVYLSIISSNFEVKNLKFYITFISFEIYFNIIAPKWILSFYKALNTFYFKPFLIKNSIITIASIHRFITFKFEYSDWYIICKSSIHTCLCNIFTGIELATLPGIHKLPVCVWTVRSIKSSSWIPGFVKTRLTFTIHKWDCIICRYPNCWIFNKDFKILSNFYRSIFINKHILWVSRCVYLVTVTWPSCEHHVVHVCFLLDELIRVHPTCV